jgi:hypothetical protein
VEGKCKPPLTDGDKFQPLAVTLHEPMLAGPPQGLSSGVSP